MHSHNYREAGPFAGQRVVVFGAAASGEDIGREIAQTAAEVRGAALPVQAASPAPARRWLGQTRRRRL